jgi:hypothetical protein
VSAAFLAATVTNSANSYVVFAEISAGKSVSCVLQTPAIKTSVAPHVHKPEAIIGLPFAHKSHFASSAKVHFMQPSILVVPSMHLTPTTVVVGVVPESALQLLSA